jgi:uncharacterized protein (TIGR02145 family)
MKRGSKNLAGLTLIEMMVSVSLLAFIILAATSVFRIVVDNMRQSGLNQGLEDEATYFFEVLSREARGAQKNSAGDCGVTVGHFFNVSTSTDELKFKNSVGDCVRYYTATDGTVLRLKVDRGVATDWISSKRYKVFKLKFVTFDDLTNGQPLLTASLQIGSPNAVKAPIAAQISVTPRYYSFPSTTFSCGDNVTVTTLLSHACNTGAPDYDTCSYPTVQIGTQCWMSQNMNIGTILTGTSTNSTSNGVLEKYCYNDTYTNCQTYGALYQWNEAMQYGSTEGAQGICPSGWHITSDAELYTLENYLTDSGQTCNAGRNGTWDCSSAGTKLRGISGFNESLAGYRSTTGSFNFQGTAYRWSSSASGVSAWYRATNSGYATVLRYTYDQAFGLSVRCLKN